jgi:predicted RNase H-like nuclease
MQPANTGREEMFGSEAPVWAFLNRFGGAANPLHPKVKGTQVIETYPVLAMIALGWTLPDSRAAGRLPKYNPDRKKTFSQGDWQYVCVQASDAFAARGLKDIVQWLDAAVRNAFPRKSDQDSLDSCLCLLVALSLTEQKDCLIVGNLQTGYIVVPSSAALRAELETRCRLTHRVPSDWVRVFQLSGGTRVAAAAP